MFKSSAALEDINSLNEKEKYTVTSSTGNGSKYTTFLHELEALSLSLGDQYQLDVESISSIFKIALNHPGIHVKLPKNRTKNTKYIRKLAVKGKSG